MISIIKESSHPNHRLFTPLPLGRRYRSLRCCTSRLRNSFFPSAISLLNSNLRCWTLHPKKLHCSITCLHSSLTMFLSFPVIMLAPVLSDLLRDSLCTALQTEKLWIWSTGLSALLTPSFWQENWVLGNLSALTERSQLGIRWTRGRGGELCV